MEGEEEVLERKKVAQLVGGNEEVGGGAEVYK